MTRVFNYERAAAILADAAYNGDEATSRRWDVSRRTIERYRARLRHDQALAECVARKKAELERAWVERAAVAILDAVEFLRRAAQSADPRDPVSIHAVAGALKILNEALLTREVIDARLAQSRAGDRASAPALVALDGGKRAASG